MSAGAAAPAVYIALGGSRVTAAQVHCSRLAADGVPVVLIVADRGEWDGFGVRGVTVHRLPRGSAPELRRRARALLRGGLLARAGRVVTGDTEALPLRPWIQRRRPDIAVQLEPSPGGRTPSAADLAVLAPWYPSPNNSMAGAFVAASIGAVRWAYNDVSIFHTESWSRPRDWRSAALVKAVARRLRAAGVWDTPEGEVTRVPVPHIEADGYAGRAHEHTAALRSALPTGRIEAPVVQAHIGIYCGVSAARLARPDARVVVTEHASFLDRVFAERAALDLYEEMLERADEVHCVSTAVRDQLTTQFPRHAAKVRIVPNVIDFDRFTARPQPVTDLLRWLYIGRFMELKRVPLVLDAFAEIAREEPRATLTLVGSGPVESALRQRIAELGLDGRVEIRPPVAPDDVVRLMHEHDLLVHASRIETFGLTVVEAVAAELPVLVARSSGPAETLAGLEGVAGSLVDLADDDAPALASAYRQLRAARAALDLPRARKELLARYGREAVGRQLIDAYRAEPAARPARAVVIALDGPAPTVKFDGRVDVFTSSPTAVGPGVHVVQPGPPRFVKAFAQRAPSTATEAFLNVADRAVEKIWRRLPGRRTARVTPEQAWSVIEPAIAWPSVDRVLVTGPRSATVGRYLAEAYPEVVVSTSTEDMCSPRT